MRISPRDFSHWTPKTKYAPHNNRTWRLTENVKLLTCTVTTSQRWWHSSSWLLPTKTQSGFVGRIYKPKTQTKCSWMKLWVLPPINLYNHLNVSRAKWPKRVCKLIWAGVEVKASCGSGGESSCPKGCDTPTHHHLPRRSTRRPWRHICDLDGTSRHSWNRYPSHCESLTSRETVIWKESMVAWEGKVAKVMKRSEWREGHKTMLRRRGRAAYRETNGRSRWTFPPKVWLIWLPRPMSEVVKLEPFDISPTPTQR